MNIGLLDWGTGADALAVLPTRPPGLPPPPAWVHLWAPRPPIPPAPFLELPCLGVPEGRPPWAPWRVLVSGIGPWPGFCAPYEPEEPDDGLRALWALWAIWAL